MAPVTVAGVVGAVVLGDHVHEVLLPGEGESPGSLGDVGTVQGAGVDGVVRGQSAQQLGDGTGHGVRTSSVAFGGEAEEEAVEHLRMGSFGERVQVG